MSNQDNESAGICCQTNSGRSAHSTFGAHGLEHGKDSNAGIVSSKVSLIKKDFKFILGPSPVDCCKVLLDWDDHCCKVDPFET